MVHEVKATPRQLIIEAEVKRMARYKIAEPKQSKPRIFKPSLDGLPVGVNMNNGKYIARAKIGKKQTYLGIYEDAKTAGEAVRLRKNLNKLNKIKDNKK